MTFTGFMVFAPPSLKIPGTWKLALYDVPVATDPAGKPTKTTRFELRSVMKKMVDTYRQASPFSQPKLVRSKEAR